MLHKYVKRDGFVKIFRQLEMQIMRFSETPRGWIHKGDLGIAMQGI